MSQKTVRPQSVPSRVSGGIPWWLWLILIVFGAGIGFTLVQRSIPKDPNLSFQEGLAAFEAEDITKLENSIQTLKAFPDHLAEQKLLEGMLIFGNSKPLIAIPFLEEAAKDPKLRTRAMTMLGNAHMRASQRVQCVETFETALKEDAEADEARLTLVYVFRDMISWEEAQKHLVILRDRKFKLDKVHQILGDIYADQDRHAEAAVEYEASLRADRNNPSNSLRASRLCKSRLETGDLSGLDEFLPEIDSAGVRDSVRAMQLLEKGETAKALSSLERALHENPVDVTANHAYAKVMEKFGTKERAIEALVSLQRPLKLMTRDRKLLESVASLATIAGDEKMALAAQQNVDQLRDLEIEFAAKLSEVIKTRDGIEARLELGDLALATGRYDLAGTAYRSVSFLDNSKESLVTTRIQSHFDVQPMLVPLTSSTEAAPMNSSPAPADGIRPLEPAPAPESAAPPDPGKEATPPEQDPAAPPDASKAGEAKTPGDGEAD